jgi:hypothetical protein
VGNTFSGSQFVTSVDLADSNPLTGGGGAANPTVAASPIAGHKSYDFVPASAQFMNTPDASHPGINALPFYLFGIIRPRANATTGVQRNFFGGQAAARIFVRDDGASCTLGMYNGGAGDAEVTGLANGTVYCFTALFNTSLMTLKVNGLTTGTNAGVGTDMMQEAIIGLTAFTGANNYYDGQALEFGVANIAPTAAQDSSIMAYLQSRAGV